MTIRLLELDVETSPNEAHVWGLRKQNIGLNQLLKPSEVICFAAKWYGKEEITFLAQTEEITKKLMVKKAWELLDEADAVIHYNGIRFDIPTLNKEFVLMGLGPPSPFKQIDLLREVRRNFRLPSYKLDYVADYFGLGRKVQHEGHELWVKCLENDSKAWIKMREYNEQDVLLLEKLYDKIKPWIKVHPNMGLYIDSDKPVCRICGSSNLVKKGKEYTQLSSYQRYKCKDCGANLRGRINEADRTNLLQGS